MIDPRGIEVLKENELVFARLDIDRINRCKIPEVIFAKDKKKEWLLEIIKTMLSRKQPVFITRADKDTFSFLKEELKMPLKYNQLAQTISIGGMERLNTSLYPSIITGGSADIQVAEEAKETMEFLGVNNVKTFYDVGCAGLHRVLSIIDILRGGVCVIVVAGMDGALASVVSGLVDIPVIGVPTSFGYGTNFGGLSALLSMLNSCANGVCVVNIDNGFAAGYIAYLMIKNSLKK